MKTQLLYGDTGLALDLSGLQASVIEPRLIEGLGDEHSAFLKAVRAPYDTRPLRELVKASERLTVVIPDNTCPLPSDRLLPWIFDELAHVPREQITILIGTGSHRANTSTEIERMVGREVAQNYRIINHDAHDPSTLVHVGRSASGYGVQFCRHYVEADRRILVGFIEPHFMAGFSGGYKAVFPGVAGIDAIMHHHSAMTVADPTSTWGRLEDNATQRNVRAGGSLVPVDFLVNVSLNRRKEITRFFCGEVMAAHRAGCAFVKTSVMIECPHDYAVVVTTNSGAPLDRNLYQTVKGMSAAAQIVKPGGLILCASRCGDGFPEHGNFKRMIFEHHSAAAMLETICTPGYHEFDQWQVQLFALILRKARVSLLSELPDSDVRKAHLRPVKNIRVAIDEELAKLGQNTPIAVLPDGALTVPYVCGA
ncbi:MAG: nickel-dependent lactate racemase [Opitutaceae bacterium]|nr:nickel-dependent lactate racemase [Opitutaceae bacterium]